MLEIVVPEASLFDNSTSEFINIKEQKLQLEHSLISIAKWESKWKKPYLENKQQTMEEFQDYVKCMTITQKVDPNVYRCITADNYRAIVDYMEDSMTATWFPNRDNGKRPGKKEVLTAEVIYYLMSSYGIPYEPCQKWHFNRLMTLIRVCEAKETPPKKMGRREALAQQQALNAMRRRQYHSKG